MGFEQIAITLQALRGQRSHFNISDKFGMILFTTMGIFILTFTLWTTYIAYQFFKQKNYLLPNYMVLAIKFGLVYFIIFSLLGGYISSMPGHTVGAVDGSKGIWFLNWSIFFGDLRVAHFFGIHSLQIIPLVGLLSGNFRNKKMSIIFVMLFSLCYLAFICFTLYNALNGMPFIKA